MTEIRPRFSDQLWYNLPFRGDQQVRESARDDEDSLIWTILEMYNGETGILSSTRKTEVSEQGEHLWFLILSN